MAKMYEIAGDVKALEALIESLTDEETGVTRDPTDEEKQVIGAWVKEASEAFDKKFDNICRFYRNVQADGAVCLAEKDAYKAELDRLVKRATARENQAKGIKGILWFAMDMLGMPKYKTALFSAGVQKTAASVKTDSSFDVLGIPTKYWKAPEMSSSAIKADIDSGILYKKPVSLKGEEIATGAFVSPLDEHSLYYLVSAPTLGEPDGSVETKLPGVSYSAGQTIVIR